MAATQLDERDFLLGVSDFTRQGALRFQTSSKGEFLHAGTGVPQLDELPEVMRAAHAVASETSDEFAGIKALLDAGTASLGGARPKASVRDGEDLAIAKFPHHSDEWNVMAWEKIALDLAAEAGIEVPSTSLLDVDGRGVLLLDRFDRKGSTRIGYLSAMTALSASDGDERDYLDLAEEVAVLSQNPTRDLRELWRRIAFSVAINNTDDHLRNHGFLRRDTGWQLSPAFEVNPNPVSGAQRSTSIGGAGSVRGEVGVLIEYAPIFDLTATEAAAAFAEVLDAVAAWRGVAERHGLVAPETGRFAGVLDGTSQIIREELRALR